MDKDVKELDKEKMATDLWLLYINQTLLSNTDTFLGAFTTLPLRLDSLVFIFYRKTTGVSMKYSYQMIR